MTMLITGATGTVGTTLLRELAGTPGVRALVRTRAAAEAVEQTGAEPAFGRFEDAESLRAALRGVERVFLLSPPGDEEMVAAQSRVVELAAEAGVGHVVKLSSIAADEPTNARIIRAQRAIEERVEASGVGWTFLRAHWFMDNELGQAESIAAEGALYAPDVGRITTIDSRDIAAAAARVLTTDGHTGRAYVLTGPEALAYEDMAAVCADVLGTEVRWSEVTLEQARESMLDGGLPPVLAYGFTEIMARYRAGGVTERVSPDTEALLGRRPRSFADFVRDHRAVFEAARPPAAAGSAAVASSAA